MGTGPAWAVARALKHTGERAGRGLLEAAVAIAARLAASSSQLPAHPRAIFVLRNNDIGDVLLVTPLLEALRALYPDAAIVAGIGDWSRDVLLGNPNVTAVLPVNAPWFNKYAAGSGTARCLTYLLGSAEITAVKRRGFDIGIDVLGSAWGSLLLMRAGVPWRLGVRGFAGGHAGAQLAIPFDPDEHVATTALRFATALGARALPPARPRLYLNPDERARGELLWSNRSPVRKRRLVLGPGGGLPEKCWPGEHFLQLLTALTADAALSLAVVGGPKERELFTALPRLPEGVSLLPNLPLRELFGLVAASDLVVTNSSMLLHVAAAFECPALVLLGPAFLSVRQHDRQWGYPGLTRTLGRDTRGRLPSVTDALEAVRQVAGGRSLAVAP